MMFNFTDHHLAVNKLRDLNLKNRLAMANHRSGMPREAWAREFCTVRCDIGRRTGKSDYILRCAKPGDLILVATMQLRHTVFNHAPCAVLTAGQIALDRQCEHYNDIYVDEPSLVFDRLSPHTMYSCLAHGGEQTFLLLGF